MMMNRRTLVAALVLAAVAGLVACDFVPASETPDDANPYVRGRTSSAPLVVPSIPTLDALLDRYEAIGDTPEGAAEIWLVAVFKYGSDNLGEYQVGRAAMQELTLPFVGDPAWEERPSYQTFVERTMTKRYVFRSYAVGAAPENGYAMDPDAFELNVVASQDDPFGDRGWAVHLESGGADSPRIVHLERDDATGLWRMSRFDNIYLDVRPPQ